MKKLSILILGFLLLTQMAFAQCTINGEQVPCDQFWAQFGWIFIVMGLVLIVLFGFWLWMLIDCIKRDFEDRVLWILIILVTNILGAIIYFFLIKRKGKKPPQKVMPQQQKPKN